MRAAWLLACVLRALPTCRGYARCGCASDPCAASHQQIEVALTSRSLVSMCAGAHAMGSLECDIRMKIQKLASHAIARCSGHHGNSFRCGADPLCEFSGHPENRCGMDPGGLFLKAAGLGEGHPMWRYANAPSTCLKKRSQMQCTRDPLCKWEANEYDSDFGGGWCEADMSVLPQLLVDHPGLLILGEQANAAMMCRARQQFNGSCEEGTHHCQMQGDGICTLRYDHQVFPVQYTIDTLCKQAGDIGQCPGLCESTAAGCRGPSGRLDVSDRHGADPVSEEDRRVVLTMVVIGSATQLYDVQCMHLNMRSNGEAECRQAHRVCQSDERPEWNDLAFESGYDPKAMLGELMSPANFGDPEVIANVASRFGLEQEAALLRADRGRVEKLLGQAQQGLSKWLEWHNAQHEHEQKEQRVPVPVPAPAPPGPWPQAGDIHTVRDGTLRPRYGGVAGQSGPYAGVARQSGGVSVGLLAIAASAVMTGVACTGLAVGVLCGARLGRQSRDLTPALLSGDFSQTPMQELAGGPAA